MRFTKVNEVDFVSLRSDFMDGWLMANPKEEPVAKERMFPVIPFPIVGSEVSVDVQDSILARVMKDNGGTFVRIKEDFVQNAGTGNMKNTIVAANVLAAVVKGAKKVGMHLFPSTARKDPENPRGRLLPFVNKPVEEAVEVALGIPMKELVLAKGMIQVRSKEEMHSWLKNRVSKFVTAERLVKLIHAADLGAVFATPDTLKFHLGEKWHKFGKYAKQPLQSAVVRGVTIIVLPNEVNMDGCALTSRHLDREMKLKHDTIKVIGIGRWDGKAETITMDIELHNSALAYDKEGIRTSLSMLTRARWLDVRKPRSLMDIRAFEFADAVRLGNHRLGEFFLSGGELVEDDSSEFDVKFAETVVHTMSVLKVVDSVDFGTLRPKVETMLYPMIRQMICRAPIDGRRMYLLVDHSLEDYEVCLPASWDGPGYEIGKMGVVFRDPAFPDTIVTMKVVKRIGDAIRVNPRMARLMGGDFDGDTLAFVPQHVLGLVKNIPLTEKDERVPEEMVMVSTDPIELPGLESKVASMAVQLSAVGEGMGSLVIGRATQTFRRFAESFMRMGIYQHEDAQLFLRKLHRHFLQHFIDGIKHDVESIDFNKTRDMFEKSAVELWPGFELRARSLAHNIASRGSAFPISSRDKKARIMSTHPLFNEVSKLGVLVKEDHDESYDQEDEMMGDSRVPVPHVIDMNKLIAKVHGSKTDMSDPFLVAIFERLSGMKLGHAPNHIFDKARALVKNDPFMRKVASRIGINPDTGKQIAKHVIVWKGEKMTVKTMICRMMDIWQGDKRAHRNMETSQQRVDVLIREGVEQFAEEFGISVEKMRVLITIVFFSYVSSRSHGMYGGLFAFDMRIIAAARMLVDGSWLMWLAYRQFEEDETIRKEEDRLGLTPGVISKLITGAMSQWLSGLKDW